MKYFFFGLVMLLSLPGFSQDKNKVKCWLLISDTTSIQNIDVYHKSISLMPAAFAIQIRGYEVTAENGEKSYLDERGKPLNKIFLVWLVKYLDWESHKK